MFTNYREEADIEYHDFTSWPVTRVNVERLRSSSKHALSRSRRNLRDDIINYVVLIRVIELDKSSHSMLTLSLNSEVLYSREYSYFDYL